MTSTSRKAFSLIELLVVISIIAVLASMLLPALRLVREAAKTTQCLGALRQMGMASMAYANDWHGALPDCKGNGADWETRISPYVDADRNGQDTGWGNFNSRGRVFSACPNATATGGPNLGYAMSYVLFKPASSSGYSYSLSATNPVQSFRMGQITYPSSRIFISERTGDQNIGGSGNLDRKRHGANRDRVNAVLCDGHVESMTGWDAIWAVDDPSKR